MTRLIRALMAAAALSIPFLVQGVPVSAAQGSRQPNAAQSSSAAARPEIATYAGAPAAGLPNEVAQQAFGLAVAGRYTFVADPVNHVVRLMIGQSEVTFAGNGGMSVEQDNDPLKTQLVGPYAVAVGPVTESASQITHLEVYIADTFGNQVRKVVVDVPRVDSPLGGQTTAAMTTIVNQLGKFGFSGDGGPPSSAQLNAPYGIAWSPGLLDSTGILVRDRQGNPLLGPALYIADSLNNRIRAISIKADGSLGAINSFIAPITQVVGGQTTTSYPLRQPRGLAADSSGHLYIADTGDGLIKVLDLRDHSLSVVAGGPGANDLGHGMFHQPAGVALDSNHDLLVADPGGHVVQEIVFNGHSFTNVKTIAGSGQPGYSGDGGPASQAQLRSPFGVADRPDGSIVIADTENNYLRSVDVNGVIHTIAGNGTPSFAGDNKQPWQAQLGEPSAVAANVAQTPAETSAVKPESAGQRFFLDTFNQAIRGLSTGSTMRTLAGKGGAIGAATSSTSTSNARFNYPMGMALDPSGKVIYVADTFNNVVRRIDLNRQSATIVAGTGTAGYSGDGKAATNAQLSYPTGLALDAQGNLYIADTYNSRVRKVDSRGVITTVAGTGTVGFTGDGGPAASADLYLPYGVTLDQSQNLYITDSFNHRLRVVDGRGTIRTLAGNGTAGFTDNVGASQAQLDRPWSSAVDPSGIYVADYLNDRIRKIDGNQKITTITGQNSRGLDGDLGKAEKAEVDGPRAVGPIGDTGILLVADSFNNRVRWMGVTQSAVYRSQLSFDPTNLGKSSSSQTISINSTGTGLLVIDPISLDPSSDFQVDPISDTCSRARLEPGTNCSFSVSFQPRTPGQRLGFISVHDDAPGSPQPVNLSGQGVAPQVSLSRASLSFPQNPGTTADPQTITLMNTASPSTGPLHIGSVFTTGGVFGQTNNCPTVLLMGANCQITVSMTQIANGSQSGTLTIMDDAPGSPQVLPLSGHVTAPGITFNPSLLTFNQNVGSQSPPQTVTLTNSGDAPLDIAGIRDHGDFIQTNNCPARLAPAASCQLGVTFAASHTGESQDKIQVFDNMLNSPQTIPMVGFGTVSSVSINPTRLTFSQNVGVTSSAKSIRVVNNGNGPLTLMGIGASGDYSQSNNCPQSIAASQSCQIYVTFTPRAHGQRNGAITISDDANSSPGSQQSIALDGFGYQPIASLSQATIEPRANVGRTGPNSTVWINNSGDGVMSFHGVQLSGGPASDYSGVSNGCGGRLSPGSSCAITIPFHPSGGGLRAATLTVFDDGGGSQAIALRGVGTVPNASVNGSAIAQLNFGAVARFGMTSPQYAVVVNSGSGPTTVTAVSGPGLSSFRLLGNSCGRALLNPGGRCMLTIAFNPQSSGPFVDGIDLYLDDGQHLHVTLTGTGI